jgi:hypothetical protein
VLYYADDLLLRQALADAVQKRRDGIKTIPHRLPEHLPLIDGASVDNQELRPRPSPISHLVPFKALAEWKAVLHHHTSVSEVAASWHELSAVLLTQTRARGALRVSLFRSKHWPGLWWNLEGEARCW